MAPAQSKTKPLTSTKSAGSVSPTKAEKTAKVSKPKDKKEALKSNRLGGDTFACPSCIRGHRVGKCNHYHLGMVKTNRPGRPPKTESASELKAKNAASCKCGQKKCICTIDGAFFVKIPLSEQDRTDPKKDSIKKLGEFKMDLDGNKLDEEEVREREEKRVQKALLENLQNGASSSSPSEKITPAIQDIKGLPPIIQDDRMHHSCCRQKRIEKEAQGAKIEGGATGNNKYCNCGPGCKCAFCVDHPNNSTSKERLREELVRLNASTQDEDQPLVAQNTARKTGESSCSGAQYQVGYFTGDQFSAESVQEAFGGFESGDRLIMYPVRQRGFGDNSMVSVADSLLYDINFTISDAVPSTYPWNSSTSFIPGFVPDMFDASQFPMNQIVGNDTLFHNDGHSRSYSNISANDMTNVNEGAPILDLLENISTGSAPAFAHRPSSSNVQAIMHANMASEDYNPIDKSLYAASSNRDQQYYHDSTQTSSNSISQHFPPSFVSSQSFLDPPSTAYMNLNGNQNTSLEFPGNYHPIMDLNSQPSFSPTQQAVANPENTVFTSTHAYYDP